MQNMENALNSYLGQKGYTILKKELSSVQQELIKTELTAKPYTPGTPGCGGSNSNTFPVYRESNKKFYVPRYYGEEKFGPTQKNLIPDGVDIDVKFAGELRDNQKPVVKTYLEHIQRRGNTGGGLLELPCAYGKCLGVDTEILMYNGNTKKVQDVIEGDLLMGDDSTPRKVLSLARGKEQMYKVETKKGEGYIVNESHILSLKCATNHSKALKKGTVIDISVLDYLKLPKSFHGKSGALYGYRVPIEFPEFSLPFDPYMMGYWLGYGSSRGTVISCKDSRVLHYFAHNLKQYKLSLIYASQCDYSICGNQLVGNNIMLNTLMDLDLIKNKHIPLIYKCNSRENRLKLLAGCIDSDGHLIKNGGFEFTHKNERLLDDIIYLARSLGFSCDKKIKKKSRNYKGEKKCGTYFRLRITGKGLDEIPNIVPRKKSPPKRQIKDLLNYRIKLTKLDVDDYYGFEIDGNRRFVLGDFTVTHNTVLSLDIISQLKKKTLIIVHKEFLLNQWVERIQQFLPGARVGRIQGQIVDIEEKDIVIGMLQSLSMKDYHESTFQSFGLTIIDEVHHISSEVFSCALFKIVTKYTLGLSATMNRKDGTTKVFKMFLGEVVFKGKRDEEHDVIVRAIEYTSGDEDFKKVSTDFRGNVQYSTMISKLCAFNPRSEFILRVIGDMLKENPTQQIMILAHNRNLLTYFHDAIKCRNISSVGYYVGGMKEAALKESESKKVIVASYAMAAEGLDIKTLTTLIMATPKTDIEQSVGRILRERHGSPVVVDIIDEHDPFKNQWNKRKTFYKKQNYKIIQTTNLDYDADVRFWKHVPTSNKKEKPCSKSDEALLETCFIKLPKK